MAIDPRRLLTFRAVAREGSFSRAAAALSLTQPAVSQQVAALERQLGTRLLERGPAGLKLTASGAIALEHADAIADRLALAGAQLAELAAGERARMRVGAFPSALATLIPAAVARLRAVAPDVEVAAEEGGSLELTDAVRAGRLHVAVAFQDAEAPRREPEGVERIDLVREPFLAAVPPTHRLARRKSVRVAELAGDDWCAPSAEHIVARACRTAGFEPRIVSITQDPLALRALVAQGLAVTLVPSLLADQLAGVAVLPLAGEPKPQRDVYAVAPPGGRHPLTAPLLDALRAVSRRR